MAKILIGYERGANMGHLQRLVPMARALEQRGHEFVFFLRNLFDYAPQFARDPLKVIASPDLVAANKALRQPKRMGSYSDIMCFCGFYRADTLLVGTSAWQTLLESVKPDLIVCDHSPVLCLAAFGQIPVVQVGSGFTLPPSDDDVFVGFTAKMKPVVDPARVLDNMRRVQRHRKQAEPRSLTEPFRTAGRLVCSLPELDPYSALRKDPVIGPTGAMPGALPPPERPAFFAYLGLEHSATRKLLESLAKSKLPGEVYVRSMTAAVAEKIARPGLTIHADPQPIEEVLGRASVVIHHGGHGTCSAALGAGRPQMIIPVHQETMLNAEAMVRLGVGQFFRKKAFDENPAAIVESAARDETMAARAREVAMELQSRSPWPGCDGVVAACLDILGTPARQGGGTG